MRRMSFWLLLGVASLASAVAHASCGAASCPIDTLSQERGGRGWVRLGYDFEYIDQDQPRIGTRKADVGEIRGHHDEVYTINRIHRLNGSIGLTDRLSLDLVLPFVSRSHEHVHHHHGEDLIEAWNFSGVGDFVTQLRYAVWVPSRASLPTVYGILGGKFPTGATHKTNEEDEAEVSIQPGSGSYDLIVGAATRQTFSVPMLTGLYATMPLFMTATYQRNGHGRDDYKVGNNALINVGTSYPLISQVGFLTQLNVRIRERDERGDTGEETDKTGGEFVYISPGLEWRITPRLRLSGLVQWPVYQRVNQIQLTSDYNLVASVSYAFRLGSERSAH